MRLILVFCGLLLAFPTIAQRDTTAQYSNGNTKLKGQFAKGERDGVWTWYHREGELKQRTVYHKGKRHGTELEFSSVRGTQVDPEKPSVFYRPLTIRNWKHDVLDLEKTVHAAESDTIPVKETLYLENGRRETEWFVNRKLKSISEFDAEGNEHGTVRRWMENGNLLFDYTYEHGKLTGDYRSYYTTGLLKGERNETAGVSVSYHPTGLIDKITYIGTDCGTGECYERYYDTGRKQEELLRLANGKFRTTKWLLDGSIEEKTFDESYERLSSWYHGGQLRYHAIYLEGTGQNTWYHPNGQRQQVGFFKDGKRAGRWQYWDEGGKLYREEVYEGGAVIETIEH